MLNNKPAAPQISEKGGIILKNFFAELFALTVNISISRLKNF
jgi:hypothetical protein